MFLAVPTATMGSGRVGCVMKVTCASLQALATRNLVHRFVRIPDESRIAEQCNLSVMRTLVRMIDKLRNAMVDARTQRRGSCEAIYGVMLMSPKPIVLLTGAAGKIGSRARAYLRQRCQLRATDIIDLGTAMDDEETVVCDLADESATRRLMEGVYAVVHLAGIPREAPIQAIAQANLIAAWNVYEAAKEARTRRVIFGSTNHVIGFYASEDRLGTDTPARPDTLYGASKVFGEALARLFWDKHGIESVCLRIGSALERPTAPRHLSTWVSYDDLNELIWCSLTAERVGYTVAYGISDNDRGWWDNSGAKHLGYRPRHRSEDYAAELGLGSAVTPAQIHTPEVRFQGGPWAANGYMTHAVPASRV
jgi:uronate dehydrogenase